MTGRRREKLERGEKRYAKYEMLEKKKPLMGWKSWKVNDVVWKQREKAKTSMLKEFKKMLKDVGQLLRSLPCVVRSTNRTNGTHTHIYTVRHTHIRYRHYRRTNTCTRTPRRAHTTYIRYIVYRPRHYRRIRTVPGVRYKHARTCTDTAHAHRHTHRRTHLRHLIVASVRPSVTPPGTARTHNASEHTARTPTTRHGTRARACACTDGHIIRSTRTHVR